MTARTIYITEADMKRLCPLLARMKNSRDDLRMLQQELERANVVALEEVLSDTMTMNSKARVRDVASGQETTYTLVFPEQADIDQAKISVVAPIGSAMLGQRAGDEFERQVPAGPVHLRVEEVLYQPEAAGHSISEALANVGCSSRGACLAPARRAILLSSRCPSIKLPTPTPQSQSLDVRLTVEDSLCRKDVP